jgi:hypothetical protein
MKINFKKIIVLSFGLCIGQMTFGANSYGYVCSSLSDDQLLTASNNQAQSALDRLKSQGTPDQMARLYAASGFLGNTSCAIGWYSNLVGLISNCVYPNLECDDNSQTSSRLAVLAGIANITAPAPSQNKNSSIGSVFNQLYNQDLKMSEA